MCLSTRFSQKVAPGGSFQCRAVAKSKPRDSFSAKVGFYITLRAPGGGKLVPGDQNEAGRFLKRRYCAQHCLLMKEEDLPPLQRRAVQASCALSVPGAAEAQFTTRALSPILRFFSRFQKQL